MKTLQELKDHVSTLDNPPKEYKVAVGSLIFTDDDKVILMERGGQVRDAKIAQGKLEGVGGSLDDETDLHEALLREINEELGDVEVEIVELLTVMVRPGSVDPFWAVPIFLCKLISGTPKIMEPRKCLKIHYLKLEDIKKEQLSDYQVETMEIYYKKYGQVPFYK